VRDIFLFCLKTYGACLMDRIQQQTHSRLGLYLAELKYLETLCSRGSSISHDSFCLFYCLCVHYGECVHACFLLFSCVLTYSSQKCV